MSACRLRRGRGLTAHHGLDDHRGVPYLCGCDGAAATAAGLQRELADFVAASTTAGVSAAVLWPDGASWEGAAGFADEAAGGALTPGDTMRIASTTEAFTAAVALQLVDEGAVGLDQAVAPLLPGLGLDEALTLRHLLGHRSGLWNFTLDAGVDSAVQSWDPVRVVAAAVARGQVFPPGSHFAYSNTNFAVAGLLIEALTGNPAEAEIRARLLVPLGCAATFMGGYEAGEVTAAPYGNPAAEEGYLGSDTSSWTAGSLVSTPADLVRFGAARFDGRLTSEESLRAMTAPQGVAGEAAHYGLGVELLEIAGRSAWGHRGGMPGYLSALFFFPDSGVTVALTADDWRGGDFMEVFARLVDLAL
ncbi:MAG: serine hydrolase domain-containing protein [Actinomycetota bacterium]